ncbi:hypothetical protein TIFTF001_024712 [Ficus carica]|uniref:Uncharacterized protein n=1 Tax=Ficus carica TaxID=3494 RepID=A0AA88DF05_FICCA|nr:hypothetical protein TIFTF001_024712 [Ficus carica]
MGWAADDKYAVAFAPRAITVARQSRTSCSTTRGRERQPSTTGGGGGPRIEREREREIIGDGKKANPEVLEDFVGTHGEVARTHYKDAAETSPPEIAELASLVLPVSTTSWCYHLQLAYLKAVCMDQDAIGENHAREAPYVSEDDESRTLRFEEVELSLCLSLTVVSQPMYASCLSPLLITTFHFASKAPDEPPFVSGKN